MATHKTYPAYKDSGIEWLGEVPQHWEENRINNFTQVVSEKNHSTEELLSVYRDYGVIIKSSREDNHNKAGEDLKSYKLVKPGYLVLNKMKTWQGSLGVSDFRGIVSPAYITCKIKNYSFDNRFLHHLLRCYNYIFEYNRLSYGVRTDQWDMRYEDFKNIKVFIPPLVEQTAIANYLDRKTSEIAAFIALKEKTIALLKERKTAIINKAVTKGLDESVQMKDSGVEWLGGIPIHWEVKKVKYLFKITGGYAFNSNEFKNEGVQLLKIANLYQNQLCLERQPTFMDLKYLKSHKNWVVTKGDILMSLTGTLGKRDYGFAILLDKDEKYLLNQRVAKLSCNKFITKLYACFILQSEMYLDQLYRRPAGTKQANLSNDDVLASIVAVPNTLKEQKLITSYIQSESSKLDLSISQAEKEISLIKEYQQNLISEAVTGKIDVRELAEQETMIKGTASIEMA